MNAKPRLISAFILSVFFTFTCVFASINDNIKKENFQDQEKELLIYKKTEKGLDVYTFTPKNQLDKETMEAIENRMKVVTEQGVLSFSADEKNLVTLIIDPVTITEDELKHIFDVISQTYGYLSSDYIIIEL